MERLPFPISIRVVSGAIIIVAFGAGAAPAHPTRQTSATQGARTVRASTAYDRNGTWRGLFGDAWRDTWSAEITVPVLDLDRYAGGLTPEKAGGNQSSTLRFRGADGRSYIFRSTAKNFKRAMPGDAKAVPVGGVAQDLTASLHPTGHLVAAELQKAVGLLTPAPMLVCLPDSPRLGKFREDFAGMLGQIEERPDENDGNAFANARKISDTEKLLDNLEESTEDRIDSRDYLTARIIDFLTGDTDRGSDQWRWAKFERGKHDVYRPVPRDHDYAFMKVDGPVPALARRIHPRLVRFGPEYPKLKSFLYMTEEFDRSHLVSLSPVEWDAVVAHVQQTLTDDVIDRAVAALPRGHRETSAKEIAAGLKARRDALPGIAREYYLLVNEEADIFASDDDERLEIHRHPDGHVDVRLWRARDAERTADAVPASAGPVARNQPLFERHFTPDETQEIRVYLERGDDEAVVYGRAEGGVTVRVIGGEGDDVLADSSHAERLTAVHFYDASGENTFIGGPRTRVSTRHFGVEPPIRYDEDDKEKKDARTLSEERRGRYRDRVRAGDDFVAVLGTGTRFWGEDGDWLPMAGYRESGGVVVGFGPSFTEYGFRRRPRHWRVGARGMVGLGSGEFGVRLAADRYLENSPWSLSAVAHVTQLESNRFYGYGNDTPWLDPDFSLVERFEVLVQPAIRYSFLEKSEIAFGPVVKYVEPETPAGTPVDAAAPLGSEPFGQAGAFAELDIDATRVEPNRQSGFGITTGVSAYPSAWDAEDDFGETHAIARAFIPLKWPTLALRAGGQRNWGSFPLHEAAFIGGRWTVRGYRWNRFAGDTSAYGSAELRMPVARISLLTRGQLGLIGFTDAGRVWTDGDSAGDWHTGYGGGLWFASMGREVSFTYAYGEQSRVYFYVGLPF